jgi:D-alanyl-D-alanine-carboxypeptidase/D-alanyl-D-alanine-endopeptidase
MHAARFLCSYIMVALFWGGLMAGQTGPSAEANRFPPDRESTGSVDDILRRTLEARGGEAAATHIQSFHANGTADFDGGGRCSFEFLATRSAQARAIFDVGAGARYEFTFDGRTAWEIQPGGAPEVQSGEKLRESRDRAAFFGWYDDPRSYRSVVVVGKTPFEGTSCHELKIITESGLEQTHYYNATNYFLAGVVERTTGDTGPIRLKTSFLEYREFAGFRFPTRIRCQTDESEWVLRLNSVQVNCVDGAAFRMPATPATPKAESATSKLTTGLSDDEIKNILQDSIDFDKSGVGLVVGLVDSQGRRVISYGKIDNGSGTEVNGDTLFEIGSITKVFTRLLLHDMVARGEMKMDDPVQKYLPAVRMPTRHGKQITLWDLSTHTSGLPRDMDDPHTVEHLYSFLASHKLRHEPGEQFEYSNVGVALLGHVIALKAGQDYESLVRERICHPLKMDSTAITLTPELQARRAVGHTPANQPAGYIGLQALPGAGAIFSTGNDMLKLASAKLGLTPFPCTPALKRAVGGHNGGTFGFSSLLAFDLKQHRAMVALSNCRNDDLLDHIAPFLKNQSPKPVSTVSVNAAVCDRYVGEYYAGQGRLATVRRDGTRLLLHELGRPSCELFPQSETNFYNQLFDRRATFVCEDKTSPAKELMIGDGANPRWRGVKISAPVLQHSAVPLTEGECQSRRDSDLQGVWTGTLRPSLFWPFSALHLKVRIAEPSTGAFRAELDSLDQGAMGQPLCVIYNRPLVEVVVLSGAGFFQGKVNPAHTRVSGQWKQGGHSIRVTFRRLEP